MGLVPGAGIGEVDAVEKYHGLVERAPTDEDVGLHALAPAFADIDRRCEAQGGLQGLDGRCGLCFPVEKRGLRLYAARRGRLAARNADLVDPQRFEDGGRIGIVRRRMLRREQEDRHRHGEDSDGYMAVQARKGCPALAAPTPEAGSLLGSDVFHLEFVGLIIKKSELPVRGPAACRPPETAAKIIVSGSIPAFAAVFFPGTGKCTGTCGRRRETGEAADGKRGQSTELPPLAAGRHPGRDGPKKRSGRSRIVSGISGRAPRLWRPRRPCRVRAGIHGWA